MSPDTSRILICSHLVWPQKAWRPNVFSCKMCFAKRLALWHARNSSMHVSQVFWLQTVKGQVGKYIYLIICFKNLHQITLIVKDVSMLVCITGVLIYFIICKKKNLYLDRTDGVLWKEAMWDMKGLSLCTSQVRWSNKYILLLKICVYFLNRQIHVNGV